jgi:heat shock protein HslJ
MRIRRSLATTTVLLALAAIVAACSGSSSSPSAAAGGLTANTWNLSAITEKVPAFQGVVPADQQANYTIAFAADGNAQIKADCNSVGATYTTSGDSLTITLGPSTLVACPEGSMADQYLAGLANASSYSVSGSGLTITLKDEGTLEFVAAS